MLTQEASLFSCSSLFNYNHSEISYPIYLQKDNLKSTRYFEEQILVKRTYLTIEMCVKVIDNPLKKEIQLDGRTRYWGFVPELDKIIRVVVLEDGETIHNAFMDRGYKL